MKENVNKFEGNMKKNFVIAIDGPAASGKSTIAKLLASKYGYIYIDTGAMYRACALCSLQNNIIIDDIKSINKMLLNIDIHIDYYPTGNKLILNGNDVSQRIRESDISKLSSQIATIASVREKMVELQRKIADNGGVIMDGRDIGTVVLPKADFKFFLIADTATRAKRRFEELSEKNIAISLEDVEKDLLWRDENDRTRKLSPLKKADDAIEINNSKMSINEQIIIIDKIIEGQ